MMAPDPTQAELLKAVLGLGLVFGVISGLFWLVQMLRLRHWRKRQIAADRYVTAYRMREELIALAARRRVMDEDKMMRGDRYCPGHGKENCCEYHGAIEHEGNVGNHPDCCEPAQYSERALKDGHDES